VLVPSIALAQASLAGVVRDASGAVLPGATVEASSPVLIEKVRTATTDGTGQYRIIDLRPGLYSVTVSLSGFSTVRRDNIQLSGTSTTTLNAELTVGSVTETVTVTGEAPTVDIQNTQRSTVIGEQVVSALPSGRSQYAVAVLVPGVTLTSFSGGNQQDVGGTGNMNITVFSVHGSRPLDGRLMINGLSARNLLSSGWASNFVPDMGTAAEVAMETSSGSAEAIGSGFTINLIPKEGGNDFRGSIFATGANKSFQSNNYSDELKAAGLASPNVLKRIYDVNPTFGGPILRNRAWFFGAMRWQESTFYYAGAYNNKNLGDPTKWNYEPDLNAPGEDIKKMTPTGSIRLTVQASPRNKFGFSFEPQSRYWQTATANQAPEIYSSWSFQKESMTTVTYSSPLTNRLLFDAKYANHAEGFVDDCAPSVNEACAGYAPSSRKLVDAIVVQDLNTGLWYHGNGYCCSAFAIYGTQWAPHIQQAQASMAYVTGAHALKVGFMNDFGTSTSCQYDNTGSMSFQFGGTAITDSAGRALTPVSIEQHALPFCATTKLKGELGIYAQDKWTMGRMSLNGGVRFDWFRNRFPDQHLGPTRWTPTRNFTIPAQDYNNLKDISPRVGVAYDLTGDGRTAVKAAWGRYVSGGDAAQGNPINNLSIRASRSWTPSLPFGHPDYYTPQCNLSSPLANGDCGALDNQSFGLLTPSAAIDPDTHTGWFNRFWSQEFSASIQREIIPRVSVDVGYFRRWYGNFQVVDNRAVTAADFREYSITVPTDSRLPNSGQRLGGLYEVIPSKAGLVDNYTTFSDNFGKMQEHWNGVDITFNARPRAGFTVQGGISTGRRSTDVCEIQEQLPESQLVFGIFAVPRSYCQINEAFLTQGKLLATYLVPKIDVQFGVTFQSSPGPPLGANYFVLPGQAGLSSFSAAGVRLINLLPITQPQGFTTATAPNIAGGTEYAARANQLDLRFSKILRFGGRYRTSLNVDLNNALNSNDVLAVNNNFGGTSWQAPLNIMDARLVRLSFQLDF
jgi:hypothetical protein